MQVFSQTSTNYLSDKSETQSIGIRTQLGFHKDLSHLEIFKNINDKLKDLNSFVETLKLESQEVDLVQLLKQNSNNDSNSQGTVNIKRYKDAIYIGQLNPEQKRHGFGVMLYTSGRRFEGQWENDLRCIRGYERHSNGNIYQGEFREGKANGHGIQTWANGEKYDGQWEMGARSGNGIWSGMENSNTYIGKWNRNKAEGYGTYTWPNGDRYDGEWSQNMKNGKGADFFNNGDTFVGYYKDGKPHGKGIYTWMNGSQYDGDFVDGLKHGVGVWKKNKDDITGHRFEGEYQYDRKHGYGEFYWQSGNIYKGSYQNDERDGYGEMYFTDGTTYKGDWTKGLQNGKGTLINPDNTFVEGHFHNNIFYGQNSPVSSAHSINFQQSPNQQQRQLRASLSSNFSQGSLISRGSLQNKKQQLQDYDHQSEDISPFQSPHLIQKVNQSQDSAEIMKFKKQRMQSREIQRSTNYSSIEPIDEESLPTMRKNRSDAQLPKILVRNATQSRLQSSQILVNKQHSLQQSNLQFNNNLQSQKQSFMTPQGAMLLKSSSSLPQSMTEMSTQYTQKSSKYIDQQQQAMPGYQNKFYSGNLKNIAKR
ncbi:UNKNOWN [Stylonychia lemnae]|uniref:Morn repeat protein n=1 Tax=Stylonychia lemnae TaxID=5949 RepID=A0A078AVB4_STYLE|nr:UNKNOWN [Stylonychia lemnae]|eukprot:CDW85222.1 UNKNOWN [Stylonychia lemnae]